MRDPMIDHALRNLELQFNNAPKVDPPNAHKAALIGFLAAVAATAHDSASKAGLAYDGPAGFVLAHGEWFEPASKPDGIPWGAPNSCHGNALILATFAPERFRLIEGFALTAGFEAVWHHSWVVERNDPQKHAIDNTWREHGLAYLGVEFSTSRQDDATWNGDATVLDDWKRGWPILQTPWKGEVHEPAFAPTEPTLFLLASKRAGMTLADLVERR